MQVTTATCQTPTESVVSSASLRLWAQEDGTLTKIMSGILWTCQCVLKSCSGRYSDYHYFRVRKICRHGIQDEREREDSKYRMRIRRLLNPVIWTPDSTPSVC